MPKRKKSKKRSKASPPVIVVALTSAVMKGIGKKKVGFDIVDIPESVGGIPVVRAKNNPVQL
ncbi:MAG: hypothetical protein DME82_08160 [Verrucomicrobia bacterium]|nr:MAG: hypothetical protein DME82_08160 [Verrucomicrobiota bacterium]